MPVLEHVFTRWGEPHESRSVGGALIADGGKLIGSQAPRSGMLRAVTEVPARAQLLIGLWLSLWLLACDPLHTDLEHAKPVYRQAQAHPIDPPRVAGVLRVMNWNIKFGGARIDFFFDCYGDRVLMTQREVTDHLRNLAAAIRHFDPDVLLLQEVDINAKRSGYVDQLQFLLDHTDLNYGVYASQWRADFIPSDGLGAMDDGNAILSRWPLRDAQRIPLARRTDQSTAERYFYLQRNILVATTDIPEPLVVVNVHTDAYGKDGTKLEHIARFERELDELDSRGVRFVAGGDLNTLPPSSSKLSGFPDSVCKDESYIADDYSSETDALLGLYAKYEPYVTIETYLADEARYFTHTVQGPRTGGFWNRTLDYLFTNGDFVDLSGTVHQDAATGGIETMPLSDHAPVDVELVWP
jgi:endonuclease/exonuclease/phosphatase family metal-dependent hydrolase